MEKHTAKILAEINMVTTNIQNNYPELSSYLEESPSTIPNDDNPNSDAGFQDYLNYLKTLLRNHMKTHEITHPTTHIP